MTFKFPKGTVIAYAALSPLAYISLSGSGGQVLCKIINIFQGVHPDTTVIKDKADGMENDTAGTTFNIHPSPKSSPHLVKHIGPLAPGQPSRVPAPLYYYAKKK